MNTGYWLPQGSILHEKYSIKKGLGHYVTAERGDKRVFSSAICKAS